MKDIQRLLDIAQQIGCQTEAAELKAIMARQGQATADIILPLVGEFSSGKTTLINALTDSKALETATKPTTATIYEIHFGAEKCRAVVTDDKGESREVQLDQLKNDELGEAYVVDLWDTSTKVPSSTVLVDTPGLSSPDPRHKQTLMSFMPQADGIILIVDINAQLTNTLVRFVADMKLSERPVFLVGTHIDDKSQSEIDSTRNLWAKDCKLPVENIAFVAAPKGDIQGVLDILSNVQSRKGDIIRKVDEQRQKNVAQRLVARITELIDASKEDSTLDKQISEQSSELRKLQSSINRLITDAEGDISDAANATSRKFESEVSSRLNAIAASKSQNFDAEAVSAVNGVAAMLMSQFRNDVGGIIRNVAQREVGKDGELSLPSLQQIDLSGITAQGLTYNIDLNSAGHEYDKMISTGLKVAAAATAVAVTAGGAGLLTEIGSSTVVEVAEVGYMARQASRLKKLEKGIRTVEEVDRKVGQTVGSDKGIVDSVASYISENLLGMGKPQRQRAVNTYIDGTLMPEFKSQLDNQKSMVTNAIAQMLQQEAAVCVQQKTSALEQLKQQKADDKAAFEAHVNELKQLKTEIESNN